MENITTDSQSARDQKLVSWIMDNVNRWENYRKTNFDSEWDEHERMVKGEWAPNDKNRDSERSRLVSPAMAQAVESVTAEIEEAVFGRGTGVWFDIDDDVADQDKQDMALVRDMLREDVMLAKMHSEMRKTFWNGALYGTGISKLIPEKYIDIVPVPQIDEETGQPTTGTVEKEMFRVKLQAINPKEFAIDPAARNVDEALGCAHIMMKPRHTIVSKQRRGLYNNTFLGAYSAGSDDVTESDKTSNIMEDQVKIVEYYGNVPENLINTNNEYEEVSLEERDNLEMVEAIVTIGNDKVLLRAVENPMVLKDRPIVAYQHETVNDCFWGRSVCKKGYNSQKALDAELRARIDAMALMIHPMVGINATMLPRGFKAEVRPGKTWLFNGNPRDGMMPFTLGNINPETFPQSAELERMVTMGTGAMDTAAPNNINPRNQTASGMSMMTSQFVKRSKRSMRNVEEDYLDKIVHKTAHRYMQFDPQRYPVMDYRFKVTSGMGIMARELEQGQLTQLLSIIPPDSPVFGVILEGVFENSSLTNKTKLQAALQQQLAGPSPEQQRMMMEQQALQQRAVMAEIKETESKVLKNVADAQSKTENVDIAKLNAVSQATERKAKATS